MKKAKRTLSAILIMLLLVGVMVIPVQAKTVWVQGGSRMGKSTNLVYSNTKYYVGRISEIKTDLWYRFKTRSTANFYTITVKNLSVDNSVSVELMDRYQDVIFDDYYIYDNDETVKNIKLKRSTYYYLHIHNRGSDSGNIKINIKTRKDRIGDTKKTARKLAIGKGTASSIDGEDDIDFIRISPARTGYYRISVKNCSIQRGYLHTYVLDRYDEQLYDDYYIYKNSLTTTKLRLVKGQYYYIKLESSYVGTYKVSVRRISGY